MECVNCLYTDGKSFDITDPEWITWECPECGCISCVPEEGDKI